VARWKPPEEQVVPPPRKRWPLVLLAVLLGLALAGLWQLRAKLEPAPTPTVYATPADVRSDVSGLGDSLEVVVSWRLTAASAGGLADSVRVEVGLGEGQESRISVTSSAQTADTLRVPAPGAGETIAGYSCASAVFGSRLTKESCTPWQFVRPAAVEAAPGAAKPGTAAKPPAGTPKTPRAAVGKTPTSIARIVVQPMGQQVDPDIGGKCAAWQRRYPERRVWIDVNRRAVPECTGPNGKPTVAQFCAFAVLVNGRRIKTENSATDPYCDQLFRAWVQQRIS
jgi:hypothetical protein